MVVYYSHACNTSNYIVNSWVDVRNRWTLVPNKEKHVLAKEDMRGVVSRLKREGLPEPKAFEDLPVNSETLGGIFQETQKAIAWLEHYLNNNRKVPGRPCYEDVFRQARRTLRQAILSDLLEVDVVQEYAVRVGAIPDPRTDYRHYQGIDDCYYCWTCDARVFVKTRHMSIHYDSWGAGLGEVEVWQWPYCPHCEAEPLSHGIIQLPKSGVGKPQIM